jgi:YspA, cpYpsA-related SLOG family
MTRIIVCGSRSWGDRKLIENTLYDLAVEYGCDITIVHGDAKGADRICEQEAQKAGLLIEKHPAEWGSLGKRAGLIRNEMMAGLGADLCVGFWDGRSTGTAHMMDAARAKGIPVRVITKASA